jgi:hypothetical protein
MRLSAAVSVVEAFGCILPDEAAIFAMQHVAFVSEFEAVFASTNKR